MARRAERSRAELIADFRELDERYAALPRLYTEEQLLRRPLPGAWCIGECVEHVALTNTAYLDNIYPALSLVPAGMENDGPLQIGGWLSALLLRSVSPGVPRKMKASRKIRPSMLGNTAAAFERLRNTHDRIRGLLEAKAQPDFNRVRFQNPLVPLIKFTVASGILIMAAHGRRHLEQAERVPAMSGMA